MVSGRSWKLPPEITWPAPGQVCSHGREFSVYLLQNPDKEVVYCQYSLITLRNVGKKKVKDKGNDGFIIRKVLYLIYGVPEPPYHKSYHNR